MARWIDHDDHPLVELDDGTVARWNKVSLRYERVPSPEEAQAQINWSDVADVLAWVIGLTIAVILFFTA